MTMFGYPSKCERKGVSHSCTLSFACWLVGGSSQSGCGASPWIVACCITSKKSQGSFDDADFGDDNFDTSLRYVPTSCFSLQLYKVCNTLYNKVFVIHI